MKQAIKLGRTDFTVIVFVPDPASTVGKGKTGLAHSDMTISYTRVETDNDVTVTDATSSLNALTNLTDAHNDWGWKEVSATLAPGQYRLDLADAVLATGIWSAIVQVQITSGLSAASPMEFVAVAYDPLDTVRLGLTALPNAAADAAGGLIISDAGGLDADAQRSDVAAILVDTGTTLDGRLPAALVGGRIDASVGAMAANVLTATAIATDAITAAKIAADAIGASELAADAATEIGTAVWASVTRTLTANTNLNDLSAAGVRTAVGLASANLDTQLADLPTNAELATALAAADDAVLAAIAALNNLSAAQVNAEVDTALADYDGPTNAELTAALASADDAVLAAIAALNNLSAAQVNAEVVDALATDTYAEPGQGAPAATASLAAKINYLFKAWRNKKTQTATTHSLFDDAGTTVDQKSTVSDDGSTATRGEMVSGP